jgi:predicted ferric reductase
MQPRGDRPIIISFRLNNIAGWLLTLLACLVPVYYWIHLNPFSNVHTMAAAMISLGRVTGLVGMVLYALNLLYATRLRFLESLFGGLNRVYIAHHILGGFALIFLSLHPLFLGLRLIQISFLQVSLLLLPNGLAPFGALFNTHSPYHAQVLQQWAITFGIIAFWGMVGLLLVTFFIQIPYRIWLVTHKLLGVFFIIGALHLIFITSDSTNSMPLRTYMLTLTAIGIASYIYRLFAGKILVRHYRYEVQEVTATGGDVVKISMLPLGQRMTYKPGQFVFIRFLGAGDLGISQEWHPFSISSGSNDASLQIAVKALGDYSKTLANMQYGTVAEIEGAYGKFSYIEYKNRDLIWVAGGIGITPFLSMARSLPDNGYRIDLYYSMKTSSEAIDWPALYDLAMARQGQFRIIPYVSDKQQGRLSADFIEQTSGGLTGKDIYICGPPMMMKSLRKQFKDKSVPGTSIHTEEFAMS